jgi:hypothetical protein
MKRYPDWQLRLDAFVRDRAGMPFAWGSNDCCLFAAAGVEALTGERPMPHLRGYTTAREALEILKAHGGLQAFASAALGPAIPPQLARIGDVVMVRTEDAEALAICNGQTVIAAGEHGLIAFPMKQALCAWRVG